MEHFSAGELWVRKRERGREKRDHARRKLHAVHHECRGNVVREKKKVAELLVRVLCACDRDDTHKHPIKWWNAERKRTEQNKKQWKKKSTSDCNQNGVGYFPLNAGCCCSGIFSFSLWPFFFSSLLLLLLLRMCSFWWCIRIIFRDFVRDNWPFLKQAAATTTTSTKNKQNKCAFNCCAFNVHVRTT